VALSYQERKAKWMKEYNVRPEVKAKKTEYARRPEVKARRKTPEGKATMKKYNASPERKAKMRERYTRPETKATIQKYRSTTQGKAKMKEYFTSPKVKTKKRDSYSGFTKNAKIIIARGKKECACCGNKNFKWLQIDHIIPQRKSKSRDDVTKLARQVVQGKRSDSEFQLLCANCNFAKRDLKACPIDHSKD